MAAQAFDSLQPDQQREILMGHAQHMPREVAVIVIGYCGRLREVGAIMLGHMQSGKSTAFEQLVMQCGGTDTLLYRTWREEQRGLTALAQGPRAYEAWLNDRVRMAQKAGIVVGNNSAGAAAAAAAAAADAKSAPAKPAAAAAAAAGGAKAGGAAAAAGKGAAAAAGSEPDIDPLVARSKLAVGVGDWRLPTISDFRKPKQQKDARSHAFEPVYTGTHAVRLWDCAGEPRHFKNFVRATARAVCGVLMVPAPQELYDKHSIQAGYMKQHCVLAYARGVRKLVVAITRMDEVNGEEKVYLQRVNDIDNFIKKIGFKTPDITFIPIIGHTGHNISTPSLNPQLKWFKGPTLFQALCATATLVPFNTAVERLPLRFSVHDVWSVVDGEGYNPDPAKRKRVHTVTGYVECGTLHLGQQLQAAPLLTRWRGKDGNLKDVTGGKVPKLTAGNIRKDAHDIGVAFPGDYVSILLPELEVEPGLRYSRSGEQALDDVGHVLSDVYSTQDPALECACFDAQIMCLEVPNRIIVGWEPILVVGSFYGPVRLTDINSTFDRKTGAQLQANPKQLRQGDGALVTFTPIGAGLTTRRNALRKPVGADNLRLCIESYALYPRLGQFILLDRARAVAVGVVKSVEKFGGAMIQNGLVPPHLIAGAPRSPSASPQFGATDAKDAPAPKSPPRSPVPGAFGRAGAVAAPAGGDGGGRGGGGGGDGKVSNCEWEPANIEAEQKKLQQACAEAAERVSKGVNRAITAHNQQMIKERQAAAAIRQALNASPGAALPPAASAGGASAAAAAGAAPGGPALE